MSDQPKVGSLRAHDKSITVVFTLDAAAYAAADLMAQPMQLVNASMGDHFGGMTTLMSITALEYDGAQGQNFTVVFHNADPGDLGALNAAPSAVNTTFESCVGWVAVDSWKDVGNAQLGCVKNIGLEMKTSEDGHLWAWLLSDGTGTYDNKSQMRITFTFYRS